MKTLDALALPLENSVLIEASAGTGKTYTITTLFLRLVAQGYSVESILVVTFTEAAAAELKQRIRIRLNRVLSILETGSPSGGLTDANVDEVGVRLLQGSEGEIKKRRLRIRAGIVSFDEAAIMTIHAFCLKILQEHAFESRTPFDVTLCPESGALLREISLDFFSGEMNDLDPLFLKYLKKRRITPEAMVSLFSKAISRPGIRVVPESPGFRDVSEDYRRVLSKIRELLNTGRGEIQDLFLTHPGINRRNYRRDLVEKWLDAAEAKLAREHPMFDFSEKGDSLYKFTYTRLMEKEVPKAPVPTHPFFELCESLMELTAVFETNLIAVKLKFKSFLAKRLDLRKETEGIYFFDDLVNELGNALEGEKAKALVSAIRKTYRAGLIDEFQDTDQRQYFIFSTLFSEGFAPFFMIGDPKQAIYAFRGGDIFAYLNAVKATRGRAYTLEKNWRSDPDLVTSLNTLFSQHPNPFEFKRIQFHPVTTPDSAVSRLIRIGNTRHAEPVSSMEFIFVERSGAEPDRAGFIKKSWADKAVPGIIAGDIAGLLASDLTLKTVESGSRSISAKDIAVLVRTNRQAEVMAGALFDLGIPAHVSKTGSVFDSRETQDLSDFLRAVLEPGQLGFVRAALVSGFFRYSGSDIDELNLDDSARKAWQERFRLWYDLWQTRGFMVMIQAVFFSEAFLDAIRKGTRERTLTNYYHLAELVHSAGVEKQFSPPQLLNWFQKQQTPAMREEASDELRLESDEESIAIVTIHKSKGLEYPVVYLPYLWEGVLHTGKEEGLFFHDPDSDNLEILDIGSGEREKALEQARMEERAENRRLLYVALTRAASLCKIIWGGFKSLGTSALCGLIHPEGDLSDPAILKDLSYLNRVSKGGITTAVYNPEGQISRPMKSETTEKKFVPRQYLRQLDQTWRFSSFSQVTSSGEDLSGVRTAVLPDSGFTKPVTLADFPKGAAAGEFFHSLFESLDFSSGPEDIQTAVDSGLRQFGLGRDSWRPVIVSAITEIFGTQLTKTAPDFCLKGIGSRDRLNELEFVFPVADFSKEKLRAIFGSAQKNSITRAYGEWMATLGFDTVKGFMTGFIDLIFRFEGCWYLVDYKSNFLGDTYGHYTKEAMAVAMLEHHYVLQYHLYVLALHRYLVYRQKDYHYNTHFGGVFYLFIRGMHPDSGPEYGVFYDRPEMKLIERFSDFV